MTTEALDTSVIVVGAGPVGLMLACELRLGGADVVVLERLTAPTTESRASTLHARTMEYLDQRGLLAALGTPPSSGAGHFGGIPLALDVPSPFAGQWKVPQARTEELLGERTRALGADVRRGHEVTGLAEHSDRIEVETVTEQGAERLRARYLVGCDGEESTVRDMAGFELAGHDATLELLRADIAGVDVPDRRFERHHAGLAIASRWADGTTRIMVHGFGRVARHRDTGPDFAEVVELWRTVTGEDIGHGTPLWLNAFGNTRRQARRYRRGRVLLAGDAAHVQMPVGGQALNLGLHDAVNLGWKLAACVRGRVGADVLDTYHEERHPVGEHVLTGIEAQAFLLLGGPEVEPLRAVLTEVLAAEPVRRRLAGVISGVDVRYALGEGDHPLLGARVPHGFVETADGVLSTAELLHAGDGVLIDLTADAVPHATARPWRGRIRRVRAKEPAHERALGFGAALVRSDGHLAWVDGTTAELTSALRRWFGDPDPHEGG